MGSEVTSALIKRREQRGRVFMKVSVVSDNSNGSCYRKVSIAFTHAGI